jgi:hypothetical protein
VSTWNRDGVASLVRRADLSMFEVKKRRLLRQA